MTINPGDISRRHVLGGALGSGRQWPACNFPAFAQVTKPKSPLSLNIVDAAGNLAL